MDCYLSLVKQYPIYTAMIQFAILGTLGDCVARCCQSKKIFWPFNLKETIWKPIEWAILAVLIKYAFIGFTGFVDNLLAQGYLPRFDTGIFRAFAISVTMNLQFGLLLVILHRILDYLPFGKVNWANIQKGFYSLIWFWIPAHTITFMLPKDYQIGLAALWSLVLGFLLGTFNKREKTK
jgi:hypothetical protein